MTAWSRVMRRHGTRRTAAPATAPLAHAAAVDADGQTHQCRISHRSLDPAGQHHDAGAGHGTQRRSVAAGASAAAARSVTTALAGAPAARGQKAGAPKPRTRRQPRRLRTTAAPAGPTRLIAQQLLAPAANDRSDSESRSRGSLTSEVMPLHLIKLAVGCDSVKELKELGRGADARPQRKRVCRTTIFTSPG